jgi:glutamyl-tRNA synthetase
MQEKKNVRVRFAPSPTGSLHIGGVRTALYNYLFARKTGGKFIIRIEDTDQSRFVAGAEDYIFNSLSWLGLEADESPLKGGPHAPYRQSERLPLYKNHVDILLQSDQAYIAFDTAEALEQARASQPEGTWQYNSATRLQMENSLSLGEEETRKRLEDGHPYVVRLKVPKNEEIRFEDIIRGWVMVHSSTLDDKVLLKSDGMPTYHLANVVDDHLMEISHVIRGEEWLPSAPTHVLLYKAFGWESTMPRFAHLPLLLKPAGDGKLSKRDGEVFGFPVFPISWKDETSGREIPGFREGGFLPEALLNFLAFLGWNPGTEQELFLLDELISAFSLERIGKSGTRFDIQKARWFNHHYLQQKPDSYFRKGMETIMGTALSDESLHLWIHLVKERCTFEHEMLSMMEVLLRYDGAADEPLLREKWNPEAASGLEGFLSRVDEVINWEADQIKKSFTEMAEQAGYKPGKLFLPLRIAMTGSAAGPDLMLFMQIIGKEACIGRLAEALKKYRSLT